MSQPTNMANDQSCDSKSIEAGVPKEGRINLENIIMFPRLKPTESRATTSSAKPANDDLGIRSTTSSRVLRSSILRPAVSNVIPASLVQRATDRESSSFLTKATSKTTSKRDKAAGVTASMPSMKVDMPDSTRVNRPEAKNILTGFFHETPSSLKKRQRKCEDKQNNAAEGNSVKGRPSKRSKTAHQDGSIVARMIERRKSPRFRPASQRRGLARQFNLPNT
jgi:hypothetical protein